MKGKKPPKDVRAGLIAAAHEVLAEGEDAALSLREVARRVGVSHPAAYHHFESRESLLAAVAADGFLRLDAAMEAASAPFAERPLEHFIQLGLAYVRFAVANPKLFGVMFRRGAAPADAALVREAAGRSFARVHAAVEQTKESLSARIDDPFTTTVLAWAAMHGLAALWVDGPLAAWSGEATLEPTAERVALLIGRLLVGADHDPT